MNAPRRLGAAAADEEESLEKRTRCQEVLRAFFPRHQGVSCVPLACLALLPRLGSRRRLRQSAQLPEVEGSGTAAPAARFASMQLHNDRRPPIWHHEQRDTDRGWRGRWPRRRDARRLPQLATL